jgi:hypothetical protein
MTRQQRRRRRLTSSGLVALGSWGVAWLVAQAWPLLSGLPPFVGTLVHLAAVCLGLVAAGALYWMLYGACAGDILSLLQALGLPVFAAFTIGFREHLSVPHHALFAWHLATWCAWLSGLGAFGSLRVLWNLMPLTHCMGRPDPDAGPEDDEGPVQGARSSSLSRAPGPDAAESQRGPLSRVVPDN